MHFSDAIVSGWSQFESIPGGMVSSICHSTISFAEDQLTSNLRYELQYLAIYWFCIFICLVIRFPKISEHSLTLSISAILQKYWQNHFFKQKKYFALSMETFPVRNLPRNWKHQHHSDLVGIHHFEYPTYIKWYWIFHEIWAIIIQLKFNRFLFRLISFYWYFSHGFMQWINHWNEIEVFSLYWLWDSVSSRTFIWACIM